MNENEKEFCHSLAQLAYEHNLKTLPFAVNSEQAEEIIRQFKKMKSFKKFT